MRQEVQALKGLILLPLVFATWLLPAQLKKIGGEKSNFLLKRRILIDKVKT